MNNCYAQYQQQLLRKLYNNDDDRDILVAKHFVYDVRCTTVDRMK